ncbi:hypothetical protein GPECTOR_278g731 [Gonium pectorale]|uniref:Uncharacterized protein n=1 Tax=Gonium pectorale TaxID=33097 RepID=A0A150FW07_GONPE|nr:hypothetical protein GPECTOR_278g731 [Gonium pectorale]|eukprot:KXZ41802.1 hypothetical protein GPECTOR_278g731 [Gonium pectorale]
MEINAPHLTLAFDPEELAELLTRGLYALVIGYCQAGKTGTLIICILFAWLKRMPVAVVLCDKKDNVLALVDNTTPSKLGYMVNRLNEFIGQCDHPMVVQGRQMAQGHVIKLLDLTGKKQCDSDQIKKCREQILCGLTVPVTFFTFGKLDLLTTAFEGGPPSMVVLDEGRATITAEQDEELIKREMAFNSLAGKIANGKFANISHLVQVTATPIDSMVWNAVQRLSWGVMRLADDLLAQQGYVDFSMIRPFRNKSGAEVFLEMHEVKSKTEYGLLPPGIAQPSKDEDEQQAAAETSATKAAKQVATKAVKKAVKKAAHHHEANKQQEAGDEQAAAKEPNKTPPTAKVFDFFDHVEELRCQGKRGLLVVDIVNPRVNTTVNTTQRAMKFARQYPHWIVLVHSGANKLQQVKYAYDNEGNINVVTRSELLTSDGTPISDIAGGISMFDKELDSPVLIIGYFTMKRSVSTRSDVRVPTHIVVAPTKGTSLADLIQMVGRVNGKNKDVLDSHGFQKVEVLMLKGDYSLIKEYYALVEWMAARVNSIAAEGRSFTLDDLLKGRCLTPPLRKYIESCSGRNMGQHKLRSRELLQQIKPQVGGSNADDLSDDSHTPPAEYQEADFDNATLIVNARDNLQLTDAQERLLLALYHVKTKYRLSELNTNDLRAIDPSLLPGSNQLAQLAEHRLIDMEDRDGGVFILRENGINYCVDASVHLRNKADIQYVQLVAQVEGYMGDPGPGGSGS